eukprot:TRINITY_DN3164_c0_g1_i1.p2 TRINITY_DN3164_c0_g1~~TRINITY_DN3164_c0_g1_i1.p2  ORF type:complete len:276 (+),score=16.14 TRINITY_DN3164_c0_g1_i1:25-828(+)
MAKLSEQVHGRQLADEVELRYSHAKDVSKGISYQDIVSLKAFIINYIFDLAKLCNARQRVAGVASVYFHRFYVKNNLCDYDPRSIAAACLFLASKVEENLVPVKHIVAYMKTKQMPSVLAHNCDSAVLLRLEVVILEQLEYDLCVEAPNDILVEMLCDFHLEQNGKFAWGLLMDSYKTQIPLLYPPKLICCAVIICTIELEQTQITSEDFLLESKETYLIDNFQQVFDIVEQLMSMLQNKEYIISALECRRLLTILGLKSDSMPNYK